MTSSFFNIPKSEIDVLVEHLLNVGIWAQRGEAGSLILIQIEIVD